MKVMVRLCTNSDFEIIYLIINDAVKVYKGIIPEDRWKVPYMSREELRNEMDEGVVFWVYEEDCNLIGVMGIQHIQDVTLIRHAYVRRGRQNQGIGGKLLSELRKQTNRSILIGTWADAFWAIRFYERYGEVIDAEIKFQKEIIGVSEVDGREKHISEINYANNAFPVSIGANGIRSYIVKVKSSKISGVFNQEALNLKHNCKSN